MLGLLVKVRTSANRAVEVLDLQHGNGSEELERTDGPTEAQSTVRRPGDALPVVPAQVVDEDEVERWERKFHLDA